MSVADIASFERESLVSLPNFVKKAMGQVFAEFNVAAQDWIETADGLQRFQREKLMVDPTAENLKDHRATLEILIPIGELFATVTNSPTYTNRAFGASVNATLQMLKDDLAMWHGNQLTDAQAGEILQKCFPE